MLPQTGDRSMGGHTLNLSHHPTGRPMFRVLVSVQIHFCSRWIHKSLSCLVYDSNLFPLSLAFLSIIFPSNIIVVKFIIAN